MRGILALASVSEGHDSISASATCQVTIPCFRRSSSGGVMAHVVGNRLNWQHVHLASASVFGRSRFERIARRRVLSCKICRGERILTFDLLVPNYQRKNHMSLILFPFR